ncbi:hypothetical protein [Nonomuraea sp. SBT364]|nr:hypothetical protein [Nonomuraea sp. SBT364]
MPGRHARPAHLLQHRLVQALPTGSRPARRTIDLARLAATPYSRDTTV